MKRIVFVGIHNKHGKEPLCPTTVSGTMIEWLSSRLKAQTIRTNFFDMDYLPDKIEYNRTLAGRDYIERNKITENDICVLLGKNVQRLFPRHECEAEIISIPHPAYPKSIEAKRAYIDEAEEKINSLLS